MKEFYKEIGSIPNQRQKEAKERREALEAAKQEVLRLQMSEELTSDTVNKAAELHKHKHAFNSTAPRVQEPKRDSYHFSVGPGKYNPINKTIMESYIHQQLAKERVSVVRLF